MKRISSTARTRLRHRHWHSMQWCCSFPWKWILELASCHREHPLDFKSSALLQDRINKKWGNYWLQADYLPVWKGSWSEMKMHPAFLFETNKLENRPIEKTSHPHRRSSDRLESDPWLPLLERFTQDSSFLRWIDIDVYLQTGRSRKIWWQELLRFMHASCSTFTFWYSYRCRSSKGR